MKKETNEIFFDDSYLASLGTIGGLHFTHREIDILAFLVSGRSGKSIASYLSISPKTVENHTRNIMTKIECNSKENVINFCEKSGADNLLRRHYENLLNDLLFKKSLQQIAKLCRFQSVFCAIICLDEQQLQDPFILQLENHLKLIGLITSFCVEKLPSTNPPYQDGFTLYVFPENYSDQENFVLSFRNNSKTLFLVTNLERYMNLSKGGSWLSYSRILNRKDYYELFFKIIDSILSSSEWKEFIPQFKGNSEESHSIKLTHSLHGKEKKHPVSEKNASHSLGLLKKKIFVLSTSIILFLLCVSTVLHHIYFSKSQHRLARADLPIPAESIFLSRANIMDQIDQAFKKNSQENINAVALVGVGGAGKTTLARQYARTENAQVIWEINAETKESLRTSFEKLAQHVAQTEEDKKILREIRHIKETTEKEEKILSFVQEHLQPLPNWLLIYDNVEQFTDIQKHFPHDVKLWGKGKIILTTQNANIQNNSFVGNPIHIGELSSDQKLDLFTKITHHGSSNPSSLPTSAEAIEFLKNIPPFPLDVSVAAYYLKSTGMPYKKYLDNLEKNNEEFVGVQENLLKETGTYLKTRYSILTLSLEHVLQSHKEFAELLLFVGLIDSQNIPFELLKLFKNEAVVDNFIYHLKKYSLITNDFSKLRLNQFFSIHRNTQAISLSYLNKRMTLDKYSKNLKEISYALDDYVDKIIAQEDFPKMRLITPHIEKFLSCQNILESFSKGLIESRLGSVYYFINNDKYKKIINNSLNTLRMSKLEGLSSKDKLRFARSLLVTGAIYTEWGLDREAQETLEAAVSILRKEGTRSHADLSWALAHLGNVHRRIRDYGKAQDYLEESIRLHKQYGTDNKHKALILAYLGATYGRRGAYQQSIDTLEKSLALYKKYGTDNHYRVGWVLVQLGQVFSKLENFQKAKSYFENGLFILKKNLSDHHVSISMALVNLGKCYRALGEYDKSRSYLEQALKIHESNFNKNHITRGKALFALAITYKALGNEQRALGLFDAASEIYAHHCEEKNLESAYALEYMARICCETNQLDKAENFAKRSLEIQQSHHHMGAYKVLEILGKIYFKKSFQSSQTRNLQEAKEYKLQALTAFQQALKIAVQHFPPNSSHIQRIQAKISELTTQP